jgi:hypothetical protein
MPAPAIGAIVKAAGTIVADTAKDAAVSKAKSFITGKGKGKGGALVKAGGQKPTVDPSSFMGRQVGGDRGGVDIPASRQTINVTAEGSDSAVGPSGGSGDVKIVQDISIAVSAIAESMKSGLILKEKAKKKNAKAAEKQKRADLEKKTEAGKPKKKKKGEGLSFKIPKIGMLDGILGFITKFIFGIAVMKLIEFAPKLVKLIPLIKGATFIANELFIKPIGLLLNGLATFIDFGYKIADGAEKLVENIFGEEGAEKFRTFMENLKTLINSFLIFKIIKGKFGEAIAKNIKNAFKLIRGFIRRGAQLVTKLFPQLGNFASKIVTGGRGLVTKGLAKVGGFAAKIFGKSAGIIAPAFKGAKPFLSKFFSKIPIVGPLVITIVSLLSGEPATQAIFKGLGGALGGALGSFIPIPILGTLIGETIGVFVGDLLYAGLFDGGIKEVGKKLKDTFTTLLKGGEFVFNFFKNGFGNFISSFMEEHSIKVPKYLRWLTFGAANIPNVFDLMNPTKTIPLLIKSFFGKKEESSGTDLKQEEAKISKEQNNKNGENANAVASETTYEGGEGNAVIIPVPIQQTKTVSTGRRNRRGSGAKTRVVVVDDTELAMYGGK